MIRYGSVHEPPDRSHTERSRPLLPRPRSSVDATAAVLDAMMASLPPTPSATQQAALAAKVERLGAYSRTLEETRATHADPVVHARRAAEPAPGVTIRVPGLAGHTLH